MKAFRIIGIALMAVLMAAGFSACSKMENDEPQKRLVKMNFYHSLYDVYYTFKYDDMGHLKNATLETVFTSEPNPTVYINSYSYKWNSQSIDVVATTSHEGNITEQYEYTFHLSEGLIRSATYSDGITPDISYGYDASNRLTKLDLQVIEWDNDKLKSITMDTEYLYYTVKYTYGTTPTVKGYSPLVPFGVTGEALILTHPELAGIKSNQIPETETTLPNDTNQQARFEYGFDKDGYLSSVVATTTQTGDESWSTKYTLEWE